MNFEDLQKTWQSQNPSALVTIKADMLLKEVRGNQSQLEATIFWRDVREVGVAFLLAFYFLYHGLKHHIWADYLSVLVCAGIGIFMMVDRLIQRRKRPVFNAPLKSCIEASLIQVRHQIWLLKNILWWYLLPLGVASAISMSYSAWRSYHLGSTWIVSQILAVLFSGVIFWGVYRLNQMAVHRRLEPRRHELETLWKSLD